MLIRYQNGLDGKPVKKAVVYTFEDHGIKSSRVDLNAVRIIDRLRRNGHQAYIVGGAVRDLLLGHVPKDYDIVTDAEPPRIRKLFYRSRVIGRRFRLVHVYVGSEIYEVSTFRSIVTGSIGNVYGTIDEDTKRRDFSMNALYFDPLENIIVDYVNGYKDIKAKKIVPVIPLKTIFVEDPVRMIRAIKYASLTDFSLSLMTKLAIKKNSSLLASASISRLGEEASKILYSGHALRIMTMLSEYKLLSAIFPGIEKDLQSQKNCIDMKNALEKLDKHIASGGDKKLGVLLSFVLAPLVASVDVNGITDPQLAYKQVLSEARTFLEPLTMPRAEIEFAVSSLFISPAPKVKSKRKRRRAPRKQKDDNAVNAQA